MTPYGHYPPFVGSVHLRPELPRERFPLADQGFDLLGFARMRGSSPPR